MTDITKHDLVDITISEVQFCHKKENTQNKRYDVNVKPNYGFLFMKEGTMKIAKNGKNIILRKGDLFFQKKGDSYTATPYKEDPNKLCIYYTTSFYAVINEEFFLKNVQKLENFEKYDKMFSVLLDCMQIRNFGYNLKAKRIIYDIIYNLSKDLLYNKKITKVNDHIQDVLKFIHENHMNKITVDDMAKVSGYSKSHFKKVFQNHTHMSPYKYLTNVRLEQAKTMLESKVFSLDEIAEKCGFSNEFYFSNAFKREVGCSPTKF